MAGVMVVVLVGYRVSSQGVEGLNPRTLFAAPVEQDALPEVDVPGTQVMWVSSKGMSPELTRLAQYIARRYRVSQMVVEPLIVAAVHEGRNTGVDPLLILAVTSVESSFNPLSESVVGAQGLMQIIPRFHLDKISTEKGQTALFDPNENFRVGALILKEYIRNTGDLETALQQYGGAPDDPEMIYSNKVLAELER
ncbi:MAG TPA: transglycosylase SLT domain-containing protein, partial [Rhodocyclaceae bacterium]|nr:transglycosylase SLT domain-containing protein [Rhodocyclaceae bacterium]